MMARSFAALLAGIIFGLGMAIAGMTNPGKVQDFFDVFGTWDPSLALVVAGALVVSATAYQFALRGQDRKPLLEDRFNLPSSTVIDAKLLIGAVLFGLGWGLSGFCPAPALAATAFLNGGVLTFVAALIAGTLIHKLFFRAKG